MPGLLDFKDKLPEADREAFAALASAHVAINSREDAEKLFEVNPFLKSAKDAVISHTTAAYDAKFRAEKLPEIVKAEVAKLNPPKDPRDVALAELQAKFEASEKAIQREKLTAYAVKKAAELNIPPQLAERFVGDSPDLTDANLSLLTGVLKPWVESQVSAAKQSLLGPGKPPKSGSGAAPEKYSDCKTQAEKVAWLAAHRQE